MWSTIAASVVDFPEPVVPVTRMIPRGSSASRVTTSGSPSSSADRISNGTTRQAIEIEPRWRNAFTRKRARPADRVGEVDLAVARELGQPFAGGEHLAQHALGVRRAQGLGALDRGQVALQPDQRLRRDLQVKVRPAPLHDSMQRPL